MLVCRLTMASIGDAQRAIAAAPAPPVLAVVADIPRAGLTGGMRARLRMTEPLVPATVMLPYVSGWRDVADPWTAAATWQQDPRPPRPMRAFVAAIQQLAAAVTPLLRPLAPPSPPAVTLQALAPTAVRSGTTPSAATTAGRDRPVTDPAAAAVIAARGVAGPATSARVVAAGPPCPLQSAPGHRSRSGTPQAHGPRAEAPFRASIGSATCWQPRRYPREAGLAGLMPVRPVDPGRRPAGVSAEAAGGCARWWRCSGGIHLPRSERLIERCANRPPSGVC